MGNTMDFSTGPTGFSAVPGTLDEFSPIPDAPDSLSSVPDVPADSDVPAGFSLMLADPAEMAREFPDLPACDRPKLRREFWWLSECTGAGNTTLRS